MGCMAWEGNPITWASTHIKHHAHSDQEDDPHSPLVSLWKGPFKTLMTLGIGLAGLAAFFHYVTVGPNESGDEEKE